MPCPYNGREDRAGRGMAAVWLEVAGISAYYETNPIPRRVSQEAVLPPKFHGLALPAAGGAGAGAGFLRRQRIFPKRRSFRGRGGMEKGRSSCTRLAHS